MPDRVLVLSYAFPPIAAPEPILAGKAVRALHRAGVAVDVVCAAPRPWRRSDQSLVDYVETAATIHRVPQPLWLPLVQPVRSLRRYPDAMRFLRRRARDLVETLDLDAYDAMLTWSQWHSVHLLGLDAKRLRPDLRWVAHFSDPWVGNPLVPMNGLAHRLALRMEGEVVRAADVLEFTTVETARHMLGRYSAEVGAKASVVPHAFDEALFPSPAPVVRRHLVARYLGTFYGARTPGPLLDGLAALRRRGCALDDLRVELVGEIARGVTADRHDLPLGLVRRRDPVDYVASLGLMRDADLLLLVDAPARENLYLANKLIDYVGAGRPIVAITPPGRAAEVVRALGGWVADPTDPEAVADALAAGLAVARGHRSNETWGAPSTRSEFELDAVGASRLRTLLA